MGVYSMMVVIFLIVTTVCVVGCVIATLIVYIDYFKKKKEYEEDIEHLKEEVRVCRLILQKRHTQGGS